MLCFVNYWNSIPVITNFFALGTDYRLRCSVKVALGSDSFADSERNALHKIGQKSASKSQIKSSASPSLKQESSEKQIDPSNLII
jgi:hypothetical protein